MSHSGQNRNPVGGFILIIVGLLFLFNNLDIFDIHDIFRNYWPLILIFIGLSIILKNRTGSQSRHHYHNQFDPAKVSNITANGETLDESKVFGEINMKINSHAFKNGNVSTVFGEVNVDLREMKLGNGINSLYLSVVFGEINVILHPDMPVSVTATTFGGEIQLNDQKREGLSQNLYIQTPNYDKAEAKLNIYCNVTLGEIKVQ